MGVSLLRHKMLSFMLSAFLAACRPGAVCSYIGTIGPDVFQVSRTYDILMIVVMGGMGSISGSVLAAFIVTIGQEWLRVLDGPLPFLPFWPESGVSGHAHGRLFGAAADYHSFLPQRPVRPQRGHMEFHRQASQDTQRPRQGGERT